MSGEDEIPTEEVPIVEAQPKIIDVPDADNFSEDPDKTLDYDETSDRAFTRDMPEGFPT